MKQKKRKILLIAACIFLVFLILAWLAGPLMRVHGGSLWILRGGLWLLGLIAAGLVVFFLWPRRTADAGPVEGVEDVDALMAAARAQLARSRVGDRGRFGKLPLLLFMGPSGGAKTTLVTRTGLESELLAGEAYRGEQVVPTDPGNVWYAQGVLVVEAGGKLLGDDARWERLVHHIQPDRLAAAFARGEQAPRLAVICFACDDMLKPGASEAIPAAARRLRGRLVDLAQSLGIRLPVYVLFTRADRLPYFGDFLRSFTRDEAQEPLGETLPLTDTPPGAYAERQAARLHQAFDTLFRSLALKRLDVLRRETSDEVKAGDYEFPREFRKVVDLSVQFLVDLCRPSQLSVSPFLRGFYFTGVRPIVVQDAAASTPAQPGPAPQAAMGATSVFNAAAMQAAARAAAAPVQGGRRVPEWVFIRPVFRDVILRDHVAMGITSGGTRVNLLRRALLVAAAAVCLVFAGGFTVSYLNNRGLERDVAAATTGVAPINAAAGQLPAVDALQRLDALRAQTARLSDYQHNGHPLSMAWGLYRGGALYAAARQVYFNRFRRLLWQDGQERLVDELNGLPAVPNETSEYGDIYNALKAYLITTNHPQESTSAFLPPVLLKAWLGGQQLDAQRLDLVRRQFEFFASELPYGNPYPDTPDEATVARARAFLLKFADTDRFYQALLTEASKAAKPIQFSQQVPTAAGVVRDEVTIPGAFTKPGWDFVQSNLGNVDRLFSRETWVLGQQPVTAENRQKLASDLQARYTADYIKQWTQYLQAGNVAGFGGVQDAAAKLSRLSDNQSPLLQLLALASTNTAVDTTAVGKAFQPVQSVVAPDAARYIDKSNQAYMAALVNLQVAVDQAAKANGPARDQALSNAASNVQQGRLAIRQIAQGFNIAGNAKQIGDAVERLLQQPIDATEAVVSRLPSADVNGKGQSFCRDFNSLMAKYPFNPGAAASASVQEVTAMFQPGKSALWSFYAGALQNIMVQQGAGYAARVGATPQPTRGFVDFFNRAAQVSHALYDENGNGPSVTFSLRPQTTDALPEITINVDGQVGRFTRTFAASKTFVWDGQRARTVSISAKIGGQDVTLLEPQPGPWALFHLFQTATWERSGTGRYTVHWAVPGRQLTITAELNLAGGVPIFDRDYLSQLRCVSEVAR